MTAFCGREEGGAAAEWKPAAVILSGAAAKAAAQLKDPYPTILLR